MVSPCRPLWAGEFAWISGTDDFVLSAIALIFTAVVKPKSHTTMRTFLIALAMTATLGLAACSQSGGGNDKSTDKGNDTTQTSESENTGDAMRGAGKAGAAGGSMKGSGAGSAAGTGAFQDKDTSSKKSGKGKSGE